MSLPEPLIPEGCSMSGNDWFPFHFDRLRKSKWWRRASDTARARNVMMWGEAFKSTPAGSLPDDDDELAEAAGYGMDVDAFLAVKEEIMAPWTLCSDGRWYHPTVCEVVLDVWEKASDRRRKDSERKAKQRAQVRGHRTKSSGVTAEKAEVTPDTADVTRDNADVPVGLCTQTIQRGQKEPPYPPGGASDPVFEETVSAYPEAGRVTVSLEAMAEAWAETIEAGADPQAVLIAAKVFAAGQYANGGGKPPRFDRWLRKGLWRSVNVPTQPVTPLAWNGPPELLAELRRYMGQDRADGYLRRATWDPTRNAIVCDPVTAGRIRAHGDAPIRNYGAQLIEHRAA